MFDKQGPRLNMDGYANEEGRRLGAGHCAAAR